MVNINRYRALDTLQELSQKSFLNNIYNTPDEFDEKQQMGLDLYNQRIFFDEVIEESLSFNNKLSFDSSCLGVRKVKSAEDLINVFKLRSDVYTKIKYQKECPDAIEGLNFDIYDKNSAILFCTSNNVISGTIKIIYDSKNKLPSEEKYSFDYLREDNSNIVELSRFVVSDAPKGLSQDFKYLFRGVYQLFKQNNIDLILSCIREEHYKMYQKFGGVNIEKKLGNYGHVKVPFFVLSWDPSQISPFFKKAFLKN